MRGEEFSCDQSKVPEEADKDRQSSLNRLHVHAAAEVTQIVLSRIGRLQPGQLSIAAALVLLVEIRGWTPEQYIRWISELSLAAFTAKGVVQ